jgi:hypothetical protein
MICGYPRAAFSGKIEYRDIKPYWDRRFKVRLLNGMHPPVPEATITVRGNWRKMHDQANTNYTLAEWWKLNTGIGRESSRLNDERPIEKYSGIYRISDAGLIGGGNRPPSCSCRWSSA